MAKLENYNGSVNLISGLTPKNNGSFPLMEAHDILVGANDKRLDDALSELASGGGGGTSSIIDVEELPTENINENAFYRMGGDGVYIMYNRARNSMQGIPINVITVNTLPDTGEPFLDNADSPTCATVYYLTADSKAYGYSDGFVELSTIGWNYQVVSSEAECVSFGIFYIITEPLKEIYYRVNDDWKKLCEEQGVLVIDITEPSTITYDFMVYICTEFYEGRQIWFYDGKYYVNALVQAETNAAGMLILAVGQGIWSDIVDINTEPVVYVRHVFLALDGNVGHSNICKEIVFGENDLLDSMTARMDEIEARIAALEGGTS